MWNEKKSLNYKILWEDKQFVLFLIIGVVKNRHFSTEGIFTFLEKNYFAIFEKTKAVSITFSLRQISGKSLKKSIFQPKTHPTAFGETVSSNKLKELDASQIAIICKSCWLTKFIWCN